MDRDLTRTHLHAFIYGEKVVQECKYTEPCSLKVFKIDVPWVFNLINIKGG